MAVIAVAAIGYIIYDKNYSTPPHIDIDFDSIAAIENADSASVDSVAEEEAAQEIYTSAHNRYDGGNDYSSYYDEDYYADSAAVDW